MPPQSKPHSDNGSIKAEGKVDNNGSTNDSVPPTAPALAAQQGQRMESAMGDAILRFLRIRKPRKDDVYDLDAIATQPSIWDSPDLERYKELYIHPQWENWSAFDPNFRWTWREENEVRRKVDWKIMIWVCVMFAALNIDRNNIQNAVSDNMLDDLGITQGDYVSCSIAQTHLNGTGRSTYLLQNIGQTISRVGFLVAELPSQLISKR
ncbi:hypothetical protein NW766_005925 [Fusarium irregulare]|uniref:Uncharacterized protein n=1 Tax=Fusarium irregulare TaxID=2494466 RepID=A0A9W8PRD4_9HYPO|nr:hypothetical protein NW766_005925 [Fusarium irregulare]